MQLPPSPTLKRRPHTPGSARRTDHQLNGSTSPASTGSRPETPLLPRDVGHQPASTLEGHTSWAGPVPSIIRLLLGTICGLILLALFLGFDGSTISVMIASLGQNTGGRAEEIRRAHTTATVKGAATTSKSVGSPVGPANSGGGAVNLRLEAALDVDGDIKLWRKSLLLRVQPDPFASFWRGAATKGCTGELYRREQGFIQGRISCAALEPHPAARISTACAHHHLRGGGEPCAPLSIGRGKAAWAAGANGASAEFVLSTAPPGSPQGGVAVGVGEGWGLQAVFGEISLTDAASWEVMEAIEGLPVKPQAEGRPATLLDPPLRMTVG